MPSNKVAPAGRTESRPQTRREPTTTTIIARGNSIKIRVKSSHLIVEDGFRSDQRTRRLHRTDRITRLVVIGHSGYISLDGLRWLKDTGAALLHLDTDGELLTTSAIAGPDFAGLRRAQAVAVDGPAGLEIARRVLALKIAGQRDVLAELPRAADAMEAIGVALAMIARADSVQAALAAESYAAASYWQAWSTLAIPFAQRDKPTVPDHWRTFGQRASLITGSPRLATDPANGILNYLYALLEAETILACHATGLDPGLGIWHTDRRDRASLALDLMEATRPSVDAYLLALLTQRTFSPRDFAETRNGTCRLTGPLAEQLADTCQTWRTHIAPIVEWTANTLAGHATSTVPSRTPITNANRRAAINARMPEPRRRTSRTDYAALPNTCRECGVPLTDRRRRYCDRHRTQRFTDASGKGRDRAAILLAQLRAEQRDPAHGGTAAKLRGQKNAAHQAAVRAWTGERPNPEIFRTEILPQLRLVPISALVAATGLSEHYSSLIRLGKRVPHPRHWDALRSVVARCR